MSKIKINGGSNGTGTFNIVAPNTNTDYTLDLPESNDSFAVQSQLGRRNLIINGAMQVAQRGTSKIGVAASGYYTCDRWRLVRASLGTHTITQETDAPDGFANSWKLECTTADASPSASDNLYLTQKLEGQDLQQLKKGTVSALPVTLSFWVKSSKTGTHVFELRERDNTRHIASEYTITSAGTWEQISITFEGDTTGALDNDNEASLDLNWWLGAGTDLASGALPTSWASEVAANRAVGTPNYASAIGQYFQITGVQLEVGSVATPFEHRRYGEELALCQRYYHEGRITLGGYAASGNLTAGNVFPVNLPATMRASPTVVFGTPTADQNFSAFNLRNTTETSAISVNLKANGAGRVFAEFSYSVDAEL